MSESCQCPIAQFCERRGRRMPNRHWKMCQDGHVEAMDNLYSVEYRAGSSGAHPVPVATEPQQQTVVEGLADVPPKKCGVCSKRKPVR